VGEERVELVTVFAAGDPVQVAMAKVTLEAAGIRFIVKGEGVQDLLGVGRLGGLNLITGPVQFQVARPDAARALEALRDVT
jgi:hypothetical protein